MICPTCGCEQRDAEQCVQCFATFPPSSFQSERRGEKPVEKPIEKPKSSLSKRASFSVSPTETKTIEKPAEKQRDAKKEAPSTKPDKPNGEQIRVVAPERRPAAEEGANKILITTTQKIEGKKISAYFGLINANIIIEMEDRVQTISDDKVFSVNTSYRSQLKTGLLLALRDLRGEAALLGANAVIATSFNFQRIDPRSLLLSAVGTAIRIEELK
jgi:uncharacterized protein YbjQ (UPF0145 family)